MRKVKVIGSGVIGIVLYLGLVYGLYLAEHAVNGSNIQDFADAMWYSVVTLTTVGYGDYYPVSTTGKLIGAVFVLSSLGILGLLIGKVGDTIRQYRNAKRLGLYPTDFEGHCVIVGWNRLLREVVNQLVLSGERVAVFTQDKDAVDFIHDAYNRDSVFVSFSELTNYENLERVGIRRAHRVLIGIKDDTESLLMLLNLRDRFGDCEYLVTVENEELEDTFRAAGALHVISQYETAAKIAASNIYEPDMARYASDLIASIDDAEDYEIQEYYVAPKHSYVGVQYDGFFETLYRDYRCVALGLTRQEEGKRKLMKLPEDDITIQPGDHIILVVKGENVTAVRQFFGVGQGRHRGSV